ncbi:hypothetical protein VHEMI09814 [[Torrubiella] hemipterigena]|uniref:GH18 domain-containing protein n=1 Tax=[Torrubiella] hemipterigena TaxID=1531966 RepID=A0A0A1TR18_9HYPO|nr:hypothetical protein VHEMI09814 [[Torrubiella] hemipterigena]
MKFLSVLTALASVCAASPVALSDANANANAGNGHAVATASTNAPSDNPRLIVYFQTTHDKQGNPISMLPLVKEKGIALTHLIACSFHINKDSEIHLNDYPPSDARFKTLWKEADTLKQSGVKIMGMIGGAAAGSFDSNTLDGSQANFDKYYGQLRDIIRNFKLEGMDLDVEQSMSQSGINRLVEALYNDFGSNFLITLAPVASALRGGANLSGFDYSTLDDNEGSKIAFYNAQFYSGFGSMSTTSDYDRIVSNGFDASRVIAGQLTAPANGYGYTPYSQLNKTVISLRDKYGQIGGVMGWEYFNSSPGGTDKPWQWAQIMTQILRPGLTPKIKMTRADAKALTDAYYESQAAASADADADSADSADAERTNFKSAAVKKPVVDYYQWVNA